jgi:uncharacterized membrane protein
MASCDGAFYEVGVEICQWLLLLMSVIVPVLLIVVVVVVMLLLLVKVANFKVIRKR